MKCKKVSHYPLPCKKLNEFNKMYENVDKQAKKNILR